MTHPIIQRFEAQAKLLDALESRETLDDAVAGLATWIELAGAGLSENDLTVLIAVGGILYREGLNKRIQGK